jgi:hypothetical protein
MKAKYLVKMMHTIGFNITLQNPMCKTKSAQVMSETNRILNLPFQSFFSSLSHNFHNRIVIRLLWPVPSPCASPVVRELASKPAKTSQSSGHGEVAGA